MSAQIIEFRKEACEGNHQDAAVKALLADRETSALIARGYARLVQEHLSNDNKRQAEICIRKVIYLLEGGKP